MRLGRFCKAEGLELRSAGSQLVTTVQSLPWAGEWAWRLSLLLPHPWAPPFLRIYCFFPWIVDVDVAAQHVESPL